jgi:hypothetical protein
MVEDAEGLLRDRTRPLRAPPLGPRCADYARRIILEQAASFNPVSHTSLPFAAATIGIGTIDRPSVRAIIPFILKRHSSHNGHVPITREFVSAMG